MNHSFSNANPTAQELDSIKFAGNSSYVKMVQTEWNLKSKETGQLIWSAC